MRRQTNVVAWLFVVVCLPCAGALVTGRRGVICFNSPVLKELPRPIDLSKLLTKGGRLEEIVDANAEELALVASRIGVSSVADFRAEFSVFRGSDTVIRVEATVGATVSQQCVRTGVPMTTPISSAFRILLRQSQDSMVFDDEKDDVIDIGKLLSARDDDADDDESDDDDDNADVLDIAADGALRLDIGELAVQYLSLEVDPYPRIIQEKNNNEETALMEDDNEGKKPIASFGDPQDRTSFIFKKDKHKS